jgi:putative transposase
MAEYKISVGNELLPGLLSEGNGVAKLVEAVLNQVLGAQMSEHLGVAMHERSEERQGYRNGTRVRALYTRVGPVSLRVPQARAMAVSQPTSSSATNARRRLRQCV